ncbi:ATP-binding cassette domain-containing protein [Lactobacillus helveticus]|uniref:ATP-binding cassette domain-containing protein n=1 Tax=Lactobacillus helveticus TaxID=1587 RepID=UPI00128BFA35|nr:ATP-binding cassette domain-containing protein [Lactobacillus helveticus]
MQYTIKTTDVTLRFHFDVNHNDRILIIGKSGVGKSTLLKIIDGNIIPDKGKVVELINKRIFLNPFNDIAYINQTPYIFSASIMENITLFDNKVDYHKVQKILNEVNLNSFSKEKLEDIKLEKNGISVSEGQKQKIEIARALFSHKSLILADEITANLDRNNAKKIRDLLFRIPNPVIEVAHHFNENDRRYTKVFRLDADGSLKRIR